MVEIGNILTLDNNQDYLMLEILEKDGKTYAYAVRVEEDETPTTEFLIFESIKEGNEEFLKVVQDRDLYDQLIIEFKAIVEEKLMEMPVDFSEFIAAQKNIEEEA